MTHKQLAYQCRRNVDAAIRNLRKASAAWGDENAYLEGELEEFILQLEDFKDEMEVQAQAD